jgi:hypothetical protein
VFVVSQTEKYNNTKVFIVLLRAPNIFLASAVSWWQIVKKYRNIFKSASNTFLLASLVYLRWQQILPPL